MPTPVQTVPRREDIDERKYIKQKGEQVPYRALSDAEKTATSSALKNYGILDWILSDPKVAEYMNPWNRFIPDPVVKMLKTTIPNRDTGPRIDSAMAELRAGIGNQEQGKHISDADMRFLQQRIPTSGASLGVHRGSLADMQQRLSRGAMAAWDRHLGEGVPRSAIAGVDRAEKGIPLDEFFRIYEKGGKTLNPDKPVMMMPHEIPMAEDKQRIEAARRNPKAQPDHVQNFLYLLDEQMRFIKNKQQSEQQAAQPKKKIYR